MAQVGRGSPAPLALSARRIAPQDFSRHASALEPRFRSLRTRWHSGRYLDLHPRHVSTRAGGSASRPSGRSPGGRRLQGVDSRFSQYSCPGDSKATTGRSTCAAGNAGCRPATRSRCFLTHGCVIFRRVCFARSLQQAFGTPNLWALFDRGLL